MNGRQGRILVLGNGQSVGPLCSYFEAKGHRLTIAARNPGKTAQLAGGTLQASVVPLSLKAGVNQLAALVAEHDLVASFLPGKCQIIVAQACLQAGVSLVVSCHGHYFDAFPGGIEALTQQAEAKGIAIISELGIDCGYLGMMAKAEIDRVQGQGAQVQGLTFHAGLLPGEYLNPFDYAFFWAAKKAALSYVSPVAGKADWIRAGQRVRVDETTVYATPRLIDIPGAGALETHPNLDSGAFQYPAVYGIEGVQHFYHGTLRHVGWCNGLRSLIRLGYSSQTPRPDLQGRPFREVTLALCGASAGEDAKAVAASYLGRHGADDDLLRLEWLGLFGDQPALAAGNGSPADLVTELMLQRLGVFGYDSGKVSRVVNSFEIEATAASGPTQIQSVFDVYDTGQGHPVATQLISETTAIIGHHLLAGQLQGLTGYHHPYNALFYQPVLREQAAAGFRNRVWLNGEVTTPAWEASPPAPISVPYPAVGIGG